MWAAAMPYFSEYQDSSDNNSNKAATWTNSTLALQNANKSDSSISDFGLPQPSPLSLEMSSMLEPALQGPPSPERIRQLSKQMKHASHLNRTHRAPSAGFSTLPSGERTGWEYALDSASLNRQPSNRSTASGSTSRPDSVQAISKNIFHRRARSSKSGRLKRESSTHSSSSSSLYSTETISENSLAALKESIMPTIFARRKSSRDDSETQKKIQISGPFNFQHVTHTPRDKLAGAHRSDLTNIRNELNGNTLRNTGLSNSLEGQEFYFQDLSLEQRPGSGFAATLPTMRASMLPTTKNGARRLMKHAKSQEQLRTKPPRPARPPRSPIEPTCSPTLPSIPPRISSCRPVQGEGDVGFWNRPQTSGSFQHPQPFSPGVSPGHIPTTSDSYFPSIENEEPSLDNHRFSHAITTPDDAAWPLGIPSTTSYETPLPDVPEEEEHIGLAGRVQASSPNNRSSLRASQSVPLLRSSLQSRRPMSGASDTLGRAESPVVQLAHNGEREMHDNQLSPLGANWEDDIDYCYEHEADANFDYEWGRPSLDAGEEVQNSLHTALIEDELREPPTVVTAETSPAMLSPSYLSVMGQSPVSQGSLATGFETAKAAGNPPPTATSNFSLPTRPTTVSHSREGSRASSHRESFGFIISPSLLVPSDYHHQMLLMDDERHQLNDGSDMRRSMDHPGFDHMGSSTLEYPSPNMSHQRASVSTTGTNSTTISGTTGERHVSANSVWTSLTCVTSSTSLNKMAGSWSEAGDRLGDSHLSDPQDNSDSEETTPPASNEMDTVPDLTPFPSIPTVKRSLHKSHASESVVRDETMPGKSAEVIKGRRPRARTTSLSAQVPPVGQYALFPRAYVKGNGDRI